MVRIHSPPPRRSRRGTPHPAPSFEGALPLCKILGTAWRPRHLNCSNQTRRSRRGTPYPAPSCEGALPLCKILGTAWKLRQLNCFTQTKGPIFGPSFWSHTGRPLAHFAQLWEDTLNNAKKPPPGRDPWAGLQCGQKADFRGSTRFWGRAGAWGRPHPPQGKGPRLYPPAFSSASTSRSHRAAEASLGIRQSPRGERATLPTRGPSGRQERLNCWAKKRR